MKSLGKWYPRLCSLYNELYFRKGIPNESLSTTLCFGALWKSYAPLSPTRMYASNTDTEKKGFSVGRLNHVAIAVPDLKAASEQFHRVLGASVSAPQSLPQHGVTVVFVTLENVKLELLEPLGNESPISNFLQKNPHGGMHHMCLEVPDIREAMVHISGEGAKLLSSEPKIGAHGNPVVFLHPKAIAGVLTEIEEVKDTT